MLNFSPYWLMQIIKPVALTTNFFVIHSCYHNHKDKKYVNTYCLVSTENPILPISSDMSLLSKVPSRNLVQYNRILYCTIWYRLCNIQLMVYGQKKHKHLFDKMDKHDSEIYKAHQDYCYIISADLNFTSPPSTEQGLFFLSYHVSLQISNFPIPPASSSLKWINWDYDGNI